MFNNINLDLVNDLDKWNVTHTASKYNVSILQSIDIIATQDLFRSSIFESHDQGSINDRDTCVTILRFLDTIKYTKEFHPTFDYKNNRIIFQL